MWWCPHCVAGVWLKRNFQFELSPGTSPNMTVSIVDGCFCTCACVGWGGAGGCACWIKLPQQSQLGLKRASCLRLLQCELLTATLTRFVKDVNFQARTAGRDGVAASSASDATAKNSSYANFASTTVLDTAGLRQNL